MKKPNSCRQVGCAGASCKYHKSTEKYPYYECLYFDEDQEPVRKKEAAMLKAREES